MGLAALAAAHTSKNGTLLCLKETNTQLLKFLLMPPFSNQINHVIEFFQVGLDSTPPLFQSSSEFNTFLSFSISLVFSPLKLFVKRISSETFSKVSTHRPNNVRSIKTK